MSRKLDQAAVHMGLEDELLPTGSKRIKSASRTKEPDSSWRPRSLPVCRTTPWPTVVINSGCSGSLSRLRFEAHWWMTSSRGGVNAVIIIAIHSSHPQLVLEKWIPGRSTGHVSGTRTQEITIIRGLDNVFTTAGAPLIIAFEEMFLGKANCGESDIVVPVEVLERIASDTWKEQGIQQDISFSAKLS